MTIDDLGLPWVGHGSDVLWSRMASRGKLVFNWSSYKVRVIGVHVREVRDRYMTHILHGHWLARLQRGSYMSADTLGACIYYIAVSWNACSDKHICWLTQLECAYIIWLLAGTLAVGVHICRLTLGVHIYCRPLLVPFSVTKHLCQLACIEHAIYYYPPFGWHA